MPFNGRVDGGQIIIGNRSAKICELALDGAGLRSVSIGAELGRSGKRAPVCSQRVLV
jgi:hypothetical protein